MVIIFFNDLIIFREKLFFLWYRRMWYRSSNTAYSVCTNCEQTCRIISWAGREKKAFSSLYVAKLIKGLF